MRRVKKMAGYNISKRACPVCARRKVKCDRKIPCSNCIKRGQESECIKFAATQSRKKTTHSPSESTYIQTILSLWQSYEYWITDIGLLKTKNIDITSKKASLESHIIECNFLLDYITLEHSFKLLNFTMENLGPLYFGCLGDISELFTQLELYWQRREKLKEKPGEILFTIDDYFWNSLLWSVFSMSVYYMPLETLETIFPIEPICKLLEIDETQTWTESLQLTLFQGFCKCTLNNLERAEYFRHPDIRLVQSFLILSTTTYLHSDYYALDSLLLQSIHTSKFFKIDSYKQYAEDDPLIGLSKDIFSKIWLRVCFIDYQQSNPCKTFTVHNELPSLLQHAAFYQDMPNFNIYKQEDSLESLCWKITSLDRDLDRYLSTSIKPQIKTFDAIKRELGIFEKKILNSNFEKNSANSQFEKFISTFLLSTVQWKLHKMYLIYFNTANATELCNFYLHQIINLLVDNLNRGHSFFNKHPILMQSFSRIIPFYAFYNIFESSPEMEQLNSDLNQVMMNLPMMLGEKINNLTYIVQRLNSMGILWEKIQVEGTSTDWNHPVFKILQDDIKYISKYNNRTPILVKGIPSFGSSVIDNENKYSVDDDKEYFARTKESSEFKFIVSEFEKEHSISGIIN